MHYKIYTDGGCSGNGTDHAVGGWATIIVDEHNQIIGEFYHNDIPNTTNNRMELGAILRAMIWIDTNRLEGDSFEIISDSAYSVNLITDWMHSWAKNNWTRGKKHQEIQNLDIILSLYKYYNKIFQDCQIRHIKGHAGELFNEYCDARATGDEKKRAAVAQRISDLTH